MNGQANASGSKPAEKLISLLTEWKKSGREVDLIDLSADGRGGAMSVIVDGVLIFAEVHGK